MLGLLGLVRQGGRQGSTTRTTTVKVTEQVKLAGITITSISRVKTGFL